MESIYRESKYVESERNGAIPLLPCLGQDTLQRIAQWISEIYKDVFLKIIDLRCLRGFQSLERRR